MIQKPYAEGFGEEIVILGDSTPIEFPFKV